MHKIQFLRNVYNIVSLLVFKMHILSGVFYSTSFHSLLKINYRKICEMEFLKNTEKYFITRTKFRNIKKCKMKQIKQDETGKI